MLKNLFKLDLRSLAFARVLLGVLAFFDIQRRIKGIEPFFSDDGILTRADLILNNEIPWRMTLLNLNGTYEFAFILAVIGMLASITYTLGWKTRISNLIAWLVVISFQVRFPMAATSGGDMLLRIILFWSLFLPMSAFYSFDRAVSEEKVKDTEYFSVFTMMWIVQIFVLYFFTFLFKWTPVYHTDFNAVWFMLQLDMYTTSFGKWLGQQYMLTRVLSAASYALELIGPLMLLIPFKRDLWRGIAVISFWCFHAGIGLTLHLGNFVPICLFVWVGLIPTTWWNYLEEKIKAGSESVLTLYYDSESLFAKQLGLILKEMLLVRSVSVVPYSGKVRGKQLFFAEDVPVVATLLKNSMLPPFRYIGKLLTSNFTLFLTEVKEAGGVNISQTAETTLHSKRSILGSFFKTSFEVLGFDKVKYKLNKAEKLFGGFILTLVVIWNIEGYVKDRNWHIGSPFDEIMFMFHIQQGWGMFAPHPQRSDGWWVMEGNLINGKKWDPLHNKEVDFSHPKNIYETYKSDDWRKFLDNSFGMASNTYFNFLGNYICRTWNKEHPKSDQLLGFSLYFMQEFAEGPKIPPREIKKINLRDHNCF